MTARSGGGMAANTYELDTASFWRDDALAHANNCFGGASQAALGILMSDECVFAELKEEGTPWMPIPRARRIELNKRYNDLAEEMVGRRLLQEDLPPEDAAFPEVRRIGEVFGGRYIYNNETEWLTQGVSSAEELARLLDRVDALDIRSFMLPANWKSEKRRIYETYGRKPGLMRHIRGPVTLACSVMGAENLIFLILDDPDLAERFSRTITRVILDMARVMDEEAGTNPDEARGFSFADDNCCLLSPPMYERFGFPVLRQVFSVYSPDPEDKRYQHSDSAMAHLLPLLGKLDLNGVNFGPTVLVPQIREHLPHARIDGCISPMTFMRNDEAQLRHETLRDIRDALRYGGVNISTAGSINNGSLLSSMRLVMSLIQQNRRG